ncbi:MULTISPECIES: PDR/VanB family oxidoreductase [Nocardioides]|uniref:PDR/VanB family oxidoreductase n=1 Tax=Nocardioides vastitatis TaxID=2568655 RepID=A0ABW0ZHQ9_9ACTN|nr:PDR/VanB family oxidoreductase [Nocardioides sp.]THJ02052.1 oxidoreductase [Nocardioides sp.]
MTATVAGTLELSVAEIVEAAPGVRSITLTAADGGELPGFVPGSHLVVDAGGRANAYSLTSDGVAPTTYSVSVLRVPDGAGGSRWLHDELRRGDTVTAHLPRSTFAPVSRARRHLLVAGGIGVTPIVSHLRAARTRRQEAQVLYVFREGYGAHVDDVVALTDGSAELLHDRQAFFARLRRVLTEQPLGTHLYVCGPAAMTDAVLETAAALGWPCSRMHHERFGVDALDPGDPFTVELTSTGATLEVPSGTSLLEALEGAGLDVPNLCRQGVCGECRLSVTAGKPLHRDLFLSEDEKAAAECVMACVSRADGPTLEIAL